MSKTTSVESSLQALFDNQVQEVSPDNFEQKVIQTIQRNEAKRKRVFSGFLSAIFAVTCGVLFATTEFTQLSLSFDLNLDALLVLACMAGLGSVSVICFD